MPPKPWETRRRNNEDISQIIQSNPTPKEEVPKLPTDNSYNNANSTTSTTNMDGTATSDNVNSPSYGPAGNYGGMGSSYGGMGSSYGGMGSSYGGYGGYGSSYGGYGGMGSSYGGYGMGMGMGMGGMYGMNRYGQQDQSQFLMSTMRTLESFTFVINSLCQIAHSINHNYEGISLFYKSFQNLMDRMKNGVQSRFKRMGNSIKNFFVKIFNFLMENIFFMRQKQLRSKYKALKLVIYISVMVFAVTCYPLVRKAIKNL